MTREELEKRYRRLRRVYEARTEFCGSLTHPREVGEALLKEYKGQAAEEEDR